MKDAAAARTIDEYIAACPQEVQPVLEQMRATVHQAAPDAQETISYQMPAFTLSGILVYFAAHPKHIGFYPTPSGIEKFKAELAGYEWAKGSVQFPLDRPMPFDLITRMVKFRVEENLAKGKKKKV